VKKGVSISNEEEDINQYTREIRNVEVHSMQDNGVQPVYSKGNVPEDKAENQIKEDSSDQSSSNQLNSN